MKNSYLAPGSAALAPMAGVTDMPFRLLCFEQGCDYAVTEMVSARGFLCGGEKSAAVRALLCRDPAEGPVALQLFGHDPHDFSEAVRRLEGRGFCGVDINMGCPAPKIVGNGDGSALLKDLPRAARIIAAVRAATPLPVTVKMRLGWDAAHPVAEALSRIAEAEGANAVTVHGRTREQFYSGTADWDAIARVKAVVHIPVIGNGDLYTAEDALARMRRSGCDGVSFARGATGNPWIFCALCAPARRPRRAGAGQRRAHCDSHAPCAHACGVEGRGSGRARDAQACRLVYARHVRRGARTPGALCGADARCAGGGVCNHFGARRAGARALRRRWKNPALTTVAGRFIIGKSKK